MIQRTMIKLLIMLLFLKRMLQRFSEKYILPDTEKTESMLVRTFTSVLAEEGFCVYLFLYDLSNTI